MIIVIFLSQPFTLQLSSALFLSLCLRLQQLVARSVRTGSGGLQEPVKVSIPRYVLRGQGKDEHFEFEVKVSWLSLVFCESLRVCVLTRL